MQREGAVKKLCKTMTKKNKSKPEDKNYWPYRPGFNHLLGYVEGKPVRKGEGIKEVRFDKSIKDGLSLNK